MVNLGSKTEQRQGTAIKCAYTIKVKDGEQPLLIWAYSKKQAIKLVGIFRDVGAIKSVTVNYHANNMGTRPKDWIEYQLLGGYNE